MRLEYSLLIVGASAFWYSLYAYLSYWTVDRVTQPDPSSTKNRVDVQLYRI